VKTQSWIKPLLISIVSIAVIGMVLVLATTTARLNTPKSAAQRLESAPLVTNQTKALSVTNVSVSTEGVIQLTLANLSKKTVALFVFEVGDERIMPLMGLSPGETTVQRFSASHFENPASKLNSPNGEIVVSALSFAGGGGEGEPKLVSELEATALGMKEHIGSVLPKMIETANSEGLETEEQLRSIEVAETSLTAADTTISAARKSGHDLVKSKVGTDLFDLKENKRRNISATYRDGLNRLIADYQKRYSQL
jgi:hypothetical protein